MSHLPHEQPYLTTYDTDGGETRRQWINPRTYVSDDGETRVAMSRYDAWQKERLDTLYDRYTQHSTPELRERILQLERAVLSPNLPEEPFEGITFNKK
jgi:hypothetical protein